MCVRLYVCLNCSGDDARSNAPDAWLRGSQPPRSRGKNSRANAETDAMRESRAMLASIRATLAVLPTTQWTVANADYAGAKLRALVDRELAAINPDRGVGATAVGGNSDEEDEDGGGRGGKGGGGADAVKVRSRAFWSRFRGGRASSDDNVHASATRSSAPPWYVASPVPVPAAAAVLGSCVVTGRQGSVCCGVSCGIPRGV